MQLNRNINRIISTLLTGEYSYKYVVDSLAEIRKTLALPKSVRQPTSSEASNASGGAKASETSDSSNLAHLLTSLNRSIVSTLKRAISQLQVSFLAMQFLVCVTFPIETHCVACITAVHCVGRHVRADSSVCGRLLATSGTRRCGERVPVSYSESLRRKSRLNSFSLC